MRDRTAIRAKGINCEVELFDHHILIKRIGLFAAGSRLEPIGNIPPAEAEEQYYAAARNLDMAA